MSQCLRNGWPDVDYWRELNIPEADDICRNVFLLQAHMYKVHDFGKKVDWGLVIDDDIESRVWMNAHPWVGTLVNAYLATRDDKYVRHLCRLFNSWYETSPPTFIRTWAQWRTLECGSRSGQRWGPALLRLSDHPVFQRECLFRMARSMLDHGKYLTMYSQANRNWLQVESSGLASVALFFPEFRLSPLFYETGMNRLVRVNAEEFLPDGFQAECSPLYHLFPLVGMATAVRLSKFLDAPAPHSLLKTYEAGVEALEYIAYPDGMLPLLNDGNPKMYYIHDVMKTGAEVFGRDDFRWFATGGRAGKPPSQASHDFTHAGFAVMRDRWGPDGQVLIFDAGYYGSGHQHEDKLNFVYYGGGRELIGDPGIYSYKHDEFEPYWRGAWSHNTILVDGLTQHRKLGPPEEMPDPDRRFVIGKNFDFAMGWYKRAYSRRHAPDGNAADRAEAVRNIQHQRAIFNRKGRYAVIADRVIGTGKHTLDILFHPSPVLTGEGANRTVRAVRLQVGAGGTVVTREPDHTNVAIVPAQGNRLEVLDLIGRKNPVRGWFSLYAIVPSHDIVYRYRGELPQHFETVIEALPKGEVRARRIESRRVHCDPGKTCAALAYGGDLFLFSYDGAAEMVSGDVRFQGTALLLGPNRADMIDGKSLTVGGRQIFSTGTPRTTVSVPLEDPGDEAGPAGGSLRSKLQADK